MADTHNQTPSKDTNVVVPSMNYFTKVVRYDTYAKISPSNPELSAAGKNVVVTGASAGIGKAIALAFAEAGAKSVAILGRRQSHLQDAARELTAAASAMDAVILDEVCELTKREEVESAFDRILQRVGPTDILVSNAGALPDLGAVRDYEPEHFMQSFNLNVLTALNTMQAFLPRSAPRPIVISVSSCIAHMKPMPNVGGYAVSKAANLKLMDYFAAENPNIHLVNLQPGTVATEMSVKAGVPGTTKVALPAHFCVWLASPEATFLKGKFVWANWDVDELVARRKAIQDSRLFTWLLEGVPL